MNPGALGSYDFIYTPVEWWLRGIPLKLAFDLDVPDGVVDAGAEAELVRSIKQQAVLKLYADDCITTGEAADALGLTRIQFLDLLRRTGADFRVELDDEDFAGLRQRRDEHARQAGQ